MTSETIVVDARGARQRVDRYLAALERWGSRANVQRLIADGRVSIDGRIVKANATLKMGQRIVVEPASAPPPPIRAQPEAIPLRILHEDDWIVVIDKPAGLVVHPATGNWRGTLVNALLHHWGGARAGLDQLRPGVVHRLDKDTSGVMIIAKDATTQLRLTEQFRQRAVQKEYLAFVVGQPSPAQGRIDQPIARHPVDRKRMAVRAGGREAVTEYKVIESGPRFSLVKAFPRTGRTHQIRVHLAAVGHPILGDRVYARGSEVSRLCARQALHAAAIAFRHPGSGEMVRYESPLPADLEQLRELIAH